MNINEEKAHVYTLMRDIAAERRMLTDTYYALQERLHKLNELEEIGLPTLKLKGYADLFNETNKRLAASNIAREANAAAESVAAPAEIAAAVRQEIEEQPETPEPDPVKVSPAVSIPFEEMDRMKRIDSVGKVKPARKKPRRSSLSMEKAREAITEILTDISTPVTSSELYRLFLARTGLDEETMTIRNFRSNILYRAMEADPRIVATDVEGTRSKTYEYASK